MRKSIIILIIVFVSFQCKNISEEKEFFQVDLDDCDQISLKLSDLIDSCRLVQLETTNESLIDNKISLLYITKDLILIGDRNGVYKFSGDGKFIKKLIKSGRGPNEISRYCRFHYYEPKKLLLIDNHLSTNDDILCYDLQSESFLDPIKKCLPVNLSDFIVFDDSLIMGSIELAGYLPQDPVPIPYALFIQNFKGDFISGIKSTKKLIHENYEGLFQRMSIHTGDKFIHVKNSHDDTIYNFINHKISPYLIPTFKNNGNMPKLLPDIGTKHIGWDRCENKNYLIINLSEFAGWRDENGFNSAVYKYDFYFLNKSNVEYAQIKTYTDDLIGKVTDIDKTMGRIQGVPVSVRNGTQYLLYFPQEIKFTSNIKASNFPTSLLSQLNGIKNKVDKMDNPILLIGVPKKISNRVLDSKNKN